ncbi:MAG: NAD-dependent epimerase/dehydratase family protein [Pseudomonadota bacterium]
MASNGKSICVVGASGLVGSNIVRVALERGYSVNGTLRDRKAPDKAPYLEALPGAAHGLNLFDADMADERSLDAPVAGTDGVFIACLIPTYVGASGKPAREMDDEQGYAEIIMPTVNGCLNIMRSAIRAGIKDIVIGSSTSSTNPVPAVPVKNEVDHWSDEAEQAAAKKYTSATKTVMEKAAIALAEAHGIRLRIMLPTLMLGPMVLPRHGDEGFMLAIKQMLKGQAVRHERAPNDSTSMAHIDDVAHLFLAAYESPKAEGRYYAVRESWHWNDIYAALGEIEPSMRLPELYEGERAAPTGFDFTRRDSLGVKMRAIPEILSAAVDYAKGQIG